MRLLQPDVWPQIFNNHNETIKRRHRLLAAEMARKTFAENI